MLSLFILEIFAKAHRIIKFLEVGEFDQRRFERLISMMTLDWKRKLHEIGCSEILIFLC